jgi:MFS transporter, ACS family, glucarate transporter
MGNPPRDPAASRPTRVRFVVLAFVCTLALITYLDRVCISRVSDSMSRDLGFDSDGVQMGYVFSAFFLGYALFEMPGGWMGDVWGARRVLGRIVIWWSAFTVVTGCVWRFAAPESFQIWMHGYPLLSVFGVLILVRFLFGAGEAGAFPNINRVTRSWFPVREWGSAQGVVWMFARLGGAVAPPVTGFLAGALGWRQAFWALGALGVAWSVIFLVWFRDRPEDVPSCNAAERSRIREGRAANATPTNTSAADETTEGQVAPVEESLANIHAWPPMRLLLTNLSALAVYLAAFGVCFTFSFYPTSQPKYYKDVFGLDSEQSELMTGLPYFCGAAGALAGGWLSDWLIRRTGSRRWGRALVGCGGFGGAGICVLAVYFATTAWQAAALLSLGLFLSDLAIPTIWAAMADIGGRFVGTLSGLSNMIGNIGGAISPVLIPVVLKQLLYLPAVDRWQYVFAGMAASWFIAAASWLFIDAGKPLEAGH